MNMNLLIESLSVLANSDSRLFAKTIKQYGLEVIGFRNTDPLEKVIQSESIISMASMITESVDEDVELHPVVAAIRRLAEDRGYIVRLIDEAPVIAPPRTRPKSNPTRETTPHKNPKRTPWNPPRPAKLPKPKASEPEDDDWDDEGLGEGKEDKISSPTPPPPPNRKSRHPLPEPTYPGSNKDKAQKAVRRVKKSKPDDYEDIKKSWQGNPFGE